VIHCSGARPSLLRIASVLSTLCWLALALEDVRFLHRKGAGRLNSVSKNNTVNNAFFEGKRVSPSARNSVARVNAAISQVVQQRRQQLLAKGMLGVTSAFSNVNDEIMSDLETPGSLGETFTKTFEVNNVADLDVLHKSVAEALQHDYSLVRFKSPAWRVETDFDGVEPPYLDQFRQVDAMHGEYKPTDSVIMISPTSSSVLQGMDWADTAAPSLLGFGRKAQRKASPEQAAENRAAKHLVLYANFGECLYFAHALANTLPRVTSILQGARDAGYKVSVVTPREGRSFYSKNTADVECYGCGPLARGPLDSPPDRLCEPGGELEPIHEAAHAEGAPSRPHGRDPGQGLLPAASLIWRFSFAFARVQQRPLAGGFGASGGGSQGSRL